MVLLRRSVVVVNLFALGKEEKIRALGFRVVEEEGLSLRLVATTPGRVEEEILVPKLGTNTPDTAAAMVSSLNGKNIEYG